MDKDLNDSVEKFVELELKEIDSILYTQFAAHCFKCGWIEAQFKNHKEIQQLTIQLADALKANNMLLAKQIRNPSNE